MASLRPSRTSRVASGDIPEHWRSRRFAVAGSLLRLRFIEHEPDFLNLTDVLGAPEQSDSEIRILALERYEDGFIVRHATPSGRRTPGSSEQLVKGLEAHAIHAADEMAMNPMGLTSLTIRDDVGTDYRLIGMTAGSVHGFSMFRPAIPAEATRLDVLTKAGIVPFHLQPTSN